LASLNERRREMAILRSVGARPAHIFALFVGESAAIMLLAAVLGLGLLYGLQLFAQPVIQTQLGLYVPVQTPSLYELALLLAAMAAGVLAGMIPAWRAYRYSLSDGMTIRI
ncbi:MAG: FtsX-like permease family protein, partial [Gammaproteobacteria bacterium]|nr:FtsX-like permease family protein [Gammaproteobacteria bacterium]